MQVAVEKLGQLERRLKVTVSAEKIEQEIQSRLKKHARTVNLKGFRPGKVPLGIVKLHYGEAVRQEVLGDMVRSSFHDALEQEKLNIAGMPHVHPKHTGAGESLEYEATFEVYPEVNFKDLSGVKIEKLKAEITEDDLAKVLEKLRNQYAEWDEIQRPAQLRDRLLIDFEGTINNEKFEGGSAKNVGVVLGSKGMIPGFEEGLVGANVNDSVELNLEFPKEYPQKDLAGKPVKFIVKIIKIMEPRLPALDDAFAEKLDVKGGIEVLRAEVQKSMQRELERNIKEEVKRQVLQHLIKHNPIDVPNALINAEIDQMQQQLKQRFAMQAGKDMKFPDLPREQFFEQAKERVIIGLLLAEFVKIQQIKADHSRVRAIIAEIASSYDNPEQIINYYFQNKSSLAQIETLVLEEQAIEKLLEAAQVEEKIVTYDEVVR